MSKTKFTPGPWETDLATGTEYENFRCIKAGVGYFSMTGGDPNIGFSLIGFISKENADLITAAPDLYESLEWLLGEIGNPEISTFGIEKCFDALAKARGE